MVNVVKWIYRDLPQKWHFEDDFFPFPVWWDMLIPWRVTILGWIFHCKIVNEKILLVVQLGNVERFDEGLEWHQWHIFDFEDGNHCVSIFSMNTPYIPRLWMLKCYKLHEQNEHVMYFNVALSIVMCAYQRLLGCKTCKTHQATLILPTSGVSSGLYPTYTSAKVDATTSKKIVW